LIPRHLEIIYEINRRFLDTVRSRYPQEPDRARRMSIIEEEPARKVPHGASCRGRNTQHQRRPRRFIPTCFARACCAISRRSSPNGSARDQWRDAAPLAPHGESTARPSSSRACSHGLDHRPRKLQELARFADDRAVQEQFLRGKREAKARFIDWLRHTTGQAADPDTIFDSQIKRIHEYKRQLLNVLHIVVLYARLRREPTQQVQARTFFFAGKAAPAYRLAKLIIKLINSVAAKLD